MKFITTDCNDVGRDKYDSAVKSSTLTIMEDDTDGSLPDLFDDFLDDYVDIDLDDGEGRFHNDADSKKDTNNNKCQKTSSSIAHRALSIIKSPLVGTVQHPQYQKNLITFSTLIERLRCNDPSLTAISLQPATLHLTKRHITYGSTSHRPYCDSLRLLCKALCANTIIERLSISSSLIQFIRDKKLQIELFTSIGKVPSLQHLNIIGDHNEFHIKLITKALLKKNRNHHLLTLGLYNLNLCGTEKEFNNFYNTFESSCSLSLQRVILFQIQFPNLFVSGLDPLIYTLTNFIQLQEVKIVHKNGLDPRLSNEAFCEFIDNLNQSSSNYLHQNYFQSLSLCRLNLSREKVCMIADILSEGVDHYEYNTENNFKTKNCFGIKRLDLSCNDIQDLSCCALANSLAGNRNLIELNLANNNLGKYSAIAIGLALKVNTTLKVLNLSNNNLGSEGCIEICKTLSLLDGENQSNRNANKNRVAKSNAVFCCVEELHLSKCQIGEQGYLAIIDTLCTNNILRELYIKFNEKINNNIAQQFLYVLEQQNNTIEELITDSILSKEYTTKIQQILRNRSKNFCDDFDVDHNGIEV